MVRLQGTTGELMTCQEVLEITHDKYVQPVYKLRLRADRRGIKFRFSSGKKENFLFSTASGPTLGLPDILPAVSWT